MLQDAMSFARQRSENSRILRTSLGPNRQYQSNLSYGCRTRWADAHLLSQKASDSQRVQEPSRKHSLSPRHSLRISVLFADPRYGTHLLTILTSLENTRTSFESLRYTSNICRGRVIAGCRANSGFGVTTRCPVSFFLLRCCSCPHVSANRFRS